MNKEIDSQNYFFTYTTWTQKKKIKIYVFRNPKTTRFLYEHRLESQSCNERSRYVTNHQREAAFNHTIVGWIWTGEAQTAPIITRPHQPCAECKITLHSISQNVFSHTKHVPTPVEQKENLNWWDWSTRKHLTFPMHAALGF